MRAFNKPQRSIIFALATGLFLCFSVANSAELVEQGKKIYTQGAGAAIACITCHGPQALGQQAANFPFLAGQGSAYLTEQLHNFASGKRENAIMKPIASALDDKQIAALMAYLQTMPTPFDIATMASRTTSQPDATDSGAWLAMRGDWANNIPACVQCHGVAGTGVAPNFPAIAGLSKTYIVEQFTLWRNGKRAGGPLDLMGNIAKRADDAQIEAVAAYFAALPAAVAEGAKE